MHGTCCAAAQSLRTRRLYCSSAHQLRSRIFRYRGCPSSGFSSCPCGPECAGSPAPPAITAAWLPPPARGGDAQSASPPPELHSMLVGETASGAEPAAPSAAPVGPAKSLTEVPQLASLRGGAGHAGCVCGAPLAAPAPLPTSEASWCELPALRAAQQSCEHRLQSPSMDGVTCMCGTLVRAGPHAVEPGQAAFITREPRALAAVAHLGSASPA